MRSLCFTDDTSSETSPDVSRFIVGPGVNQCGGRLAFADAHVLLDELTFVELAGISTR